MRPRAYSSAAERQRAYRERRRNAKNVTFDTFAPAHEPAGARYYHGDARHMTMIADASAHLVATSPPYYNARAEYASWPSYAAYLADMALVWAECYRVLAPGGRIAINVPDGYGRPATGGYLSIGDDTARALQAAGFALRGKVIWDKGAAARSSTAWGSWLSASDPSLRDGHEVIIIAHKDRPRRPGPPAVDRETFLAATVSIWQIAPARRGWHPAPWPAEIPRRLIALYTWPGDVVLDPFAGSGTTVQVAQNLGRQGIGIELCAEYLVRLTTAPQRG
jgi:DNA modification methylase